jgi:hypothetical protein
MASGSHWSYFRRQESLQSVTKLPVWLLSFLIAIHVSNISMWHCIMSIMVDWALSLSLADFTVHSIMPLILPKQGHPVQRRIILIQRSLWSYLNSFICVGWLERMLALLMIPWAPPLTQSHHSQFDVSSQGCQTVKLFHFLTWVVTSLFLERVGALLRT